MVSKKARKKKKGPPVEAGLYLHYKGKLYWVIGTATHTETGETLVVYYASQDMAAGLFVRPLSMWNKPIIMYGKPQGPRFSRIVWRDA